MTMPRGHWVPPHNTAYSQVILHCLKVMEQMIEYCVIAILMSISLWTHSLPQAKEGSHHAAAHVTNFLLQIKGSSMWS